MSSQQRSIPVAPVDAIDPSAKAGRALAWALWAYWTILSLVACPYEDTVRDIVTALGIDDGSPLPTTGPGLAFSAHLGPAWFYLLAPVAAVSTSWLTIAGFIAALAGLKFPLAYRFGSVVGAPRFGALFAVALLLPGWQHLESMLATHTSLVETLLLAWLLLLRRYLLQPDVGSALLLGLGFSLALHAHPTAMALLPVGLIAAWRWGGRAVWNPLHAVAAAVAALVPFVPYLAAQSRDGWSDAATASGYLQQSVGLQQLTHVPALAAALLWSGPHSLIDALLSPGARNLAFALWATWLAAAVALAVLTWRRIAPAQKAIVGNALLAWIMTLCTLCILRDRVPWYMAYAPTLACAAVLAALWNAIATTGGRLRWVAFVAAVCTAALGVALDAGLWRESGRGEFLLPGAAMHDTLSGYEPPAPSPVIGGTSLPARYAAASGRFLCGHRDSVLHGSYGSYVDNTAALDERLMCAQPQTLQIGAGAGIPLDRHWVGLPRRLWRELGRDPETWVGPFGLARPVAVSASALTLPVSKGDRYPQREALPPGSDSFEVHLDLPGGAALVTSAVLGYIGAATIDRVSANGLPQTVTATTAFVDVYLCTMCDRADPVHWTVRFRAHEIGLLDVFGLAP